MGSLSFLRVNALDTHEPPSRGSIRPDMPNAMPLVYACGYSDLLEDVGEGGCFSVPDGPGLGVSYDWGLIEKNRTPHHVFE